MTLPSGWNNPVLTKEVRTRMRGARAFWILFFYLFFLSLILFVTYLVWWRSQQDGDVGGEAFTVGRTFYSTLFIMQAILVGVITPALTAGGVSIEREQRTYELLAVSLLPRRSIVTGKLFSAVAFVALLLVASLPLVSVGFLLGGVSPGEVFGACALLVSTAFLYGACGMACSAVSKNTTAATVLAYLSIGSLFFASLPLSLLAAPGFFGAPGGIGARGIGLTALNPIGAISAVTQKEMYFGVSVPAWLTAIVLNGLLGTIFTVIAIHRLDYPRTDRAGLLRILTLLFVGLMAFCFFGITLPGNAASAITASGSAAQPAMYVFCLVPFVVVLFATGETLPARGGVWSLLNPLRLRRGEAPSGLLYSLLLVGLCGAVLYAGARVGPGASQLKTVLGPTRMTFTVSLAAAFSFGALGLFLTAGLRNRWSALGATLALMCLAYFLPMTLYATRVGPNAVRASLADNLLYLSPVAALADYFDTKKDIRRSPYLFGGNAPLWQGTTALALTSGVLFLAGAGLLDRRGRRRAPAAS